MKWIRTREQLQGHVAKCQCTDYSFEWGQCVIQNHSQIGHKGRTEWSSSDSVNAGSQKNYVGTNFIYM